MILSIRRAEYDKSKGKWVLEYDVMPNGGIKYTQKVEFSAEQALKTYKKQLQDYIAQIHRSREEEFG